MTMVYLIRHAEAEGNLYRRVQGQYDGRITHMGQKQIDALAERFKDTHIDALYSSDLSRAMQTATAIQRHHRIPLMTTPSLREIHLGTWEGRPWGEAERDYPEQMVYFNNNPDLFSLPEAETFPELRERITSAIIELAGRHEGQTIAAVCHGMAIRTFLAGVMNIGSQEIHRVLHGDNTSVSLLKVTNGCIEIEYYNDNSHLPEEISTFAKQTWWKEEAATDNQNLRFTPLDLETEAAAYLKCYAETWQISNGSLEGFDEGDFMKSAREHIEAHPLALMKVELGDEFAGIIELNPQRTREYSAGWVSLAYLTPEFRGRGLAIQLIGHGVSVYRDLGRRCIRLQVSQRNKSALDFYSRFGFDKIAESQGHASVYDIMELPITASYIEATEYSSQEAQ